MSDVSSLFVKLYESEVSAAYQQEGSLFQSMVRSKSVTNAAKVQFPWLGKMEATTKSGTGKIPTSKIEHKPVEVELTDYYAAATIDETDLDKINYDERAQYAKMGAYALGRKTDEVIIDAMVKGQTTDTGSADTSFNMALIRSIISKFNKADVPDDRQRFCAVGPEQWEYLMKQDVFVRSDYVGDLYPLLKNKENRLWRGIVWFQSNMLIKPSAATTTNLLFHKTAVGCANGKKVSSKVEYRIDYDDYFAMNKMAIGAKVIDNTGVIKFTTKDAMAAD